MQRTILVVDDEPMNTKLIQFILSKVPEYQVLCASGGAEALELFGTEPIELVLLDLNMPEMDGFETLRRIREISQAPVVFLTADDEKDHPGHLADAFLKKPVVAQELMEMTERFL